MAQIVFIPENIPISNDRQQELYEGWSDLATDYPWTDSEQETVRDRCREALSELPESAKKQLQIATLYLVFGDRESTISHNAIADVVGCSKSYIRQFDYVYEEQKVLHRQGINSDLRDEILGRNDKTCVKCGSGCDIEVHHIIPRSQGGQNEIENLTSLCHSCHWAAHGETWDKVNYESTEEFWNWVKS
ncbi:HNH endonuclease [Haloarcula argentinensis]|uniref:HNH endonuclease n=1 Tax=Haloarcula argentinensis TaxID=43776 RepID=A0ABU2F5S1_HALAR|nr:HNH endonuclease [Haloarcula argentinensis]MDS0255935.1 HNH endonuclease [Haloarcula argentinensis]